MGPPSSPHFRPSKNRAVHFGHGSGWNGQIALHWSDSTSAKFLDTAFRNFHDKPFAVLAFARPEVDDLLPEIWADRNLVQIRLHPLSRRAAESLIKGTLGDSVESETVQIIVERSGGNAFYLEELLRAVTTGHKESSLRNAPIADTSWNAVKHFALFSNVQRCAAERAIRTAQEMLQEDGVESGISYILSRNMRIYEWLRFSATLLIRAEAHDAAGNMDAAKEAIRGARDDLLIRAEKIDDPKYRQSFLEHVPVHARALALAREWLPRGDS